MTQINKLSAVDSVQSGDHVPIFDTSNGDARRAAMSVLLAYMQANLTLPTFTGQGTYTTHYAAPSTSGFNVTVTDGASNNTNVHLILTPTTGFAAGTITLPVHTGLTDKQEVLINCTQQITALTVAGNGATVTGEPTSMGADDFFRLKYDLTTNTWYRVG